VHGKQLMDQPLTDLDETTGLPRYMTHNELPLATPSMSSMKDHWQSWFAMANDRANSTPAYVMMNVLMLREHNRIAGLLAAEYADEWKAHTDPTYFDERVFQTTRCILIVLLLKIVMEEYINHITPYHFKLKVDPSALFPRKTIWSRCFPRASKMEKMAKWRWTNWMSVEFNILYRWHSMIPDQIQLGGKQHETLETLWNTKLITDNGIGPLFEEISTQPAGEISAKNTWEWLVKFAEVPAIIMGRDTQLDSYNAYRRLCQLPAFDRWEQFSGNPEIQAALRELYGEVDRVELFAGLFSEEPREDAALASLMGLLVGIDAFSQALNNPLLHQNLFNKETFSERGLALIGETQSLEQLVNRNTPESNGEAFKVSMTRSDWVHSSFQKS
jgi:prostaglandin-endoperoxide synthase 2